MTYGSDEELVRASAALPGEGQAATLRGSGVGESERSNEGERGESEECAEQMSGHGRKWMGE